MYSKEQLKQVVHYHTTSTPPTVTKAEKTVVTIGTETVIDISPGKAPTKPLREAESAKQDLEGNPPKLTQAASPQKLLQSPRKVSPSKKGPPKGKPSRGNTEGEQTSTRSPRATNVGALSARKDMPETGKIVCTQAKLAINRMCLYSNPLPMNDAYSVSC